MPPNKVRISKSGKSSFILASEAENRPNYEPNAGESVTFPP